MGIRRSRIYLYRPNTREGIALTELPTPEGHDRGSAPSKCLATPMLGVAKLLALDAPAPHVPLHDRVLHSLWIGLHSAANFE